ncbi:kinesin light chain 4 isoform, partial [Candidatus Magnetobacterium bavaricum]
MFKGFQDRHYAIIPCPKNDYAEMESGRLATKYNIVPVFYKNQDESHAEREGILTDILNYCKAKTKKKPTATKASPNSKEHALTQYKLRLDAELANLRILDMSRPLNLTEIYIKISLREKALKIYKSVYGENHPDVAMMYRNIGVVWRNLGKKNKALEYYKKALSIFEAFYGADHPDTKMVRDKIAEASPV